MPAVSQMRVFKEEARAPVGGEATKCAAAFWPCHRLRYIRRAAPERYSKLRGCEFGSEIKAVLPKNTGGSQPRTPQEASIDAIPTHWNYRAKGLRTLPGMYDLRTRGRRARGSPNRRPLRRRPAATSSIPPTFTPSALRRKSPDALSRSGASNWSWPPRSASTPIFSSASRLAPTNGGFRANISWTRSKAVLSVWTPTI